MRSRSAAAWLPCFATIVVPGAIALAAEAPEKPLSVTAGLGYVSSAGNSDVQTLTGSDKVEYRAGKWKHVQEGDALWGTDDGAENAGRYRIGLRSDFELSERLAIYGLASWKRDVFSGVARQFDEGAGLSFHAIVPKPQLLDLEAGAGLLQRRDTFDQDQDFSTGRLGVVYRYYFAEKTYADAQGVYLHNFETPDDYEWDSRASAVAPLSNILAMKISYTYHYRNQPPPGIRQWDSTFAAGIQAAW